MTATYQETDDGSGQNRGISVGAAAGTASISFTAASAGAGNQLQGQWQTAQGHPGTPSIIGACVIRWNITTANANLTWVQVQWHINAGAGDNGITDTTVAVGLGTTGIKTVSCEVTSVQNFDAFCNTASAIMRVYRNITSGSTMVGVFVWQSNSTITFPWTAGSGSTTAAAVYSLAQLGAGQ